jgi:hypothetical protein
MKFSIANLSPIHTRCSVTSDLIPQYAQRFLSPSPTSSGAVWHRLADIDRETMYCFSMTFLCGRFAAIRRAHCKPGSHACPPLVSCLQIADRSPRNGCMNDWCYVDSSSTIERSVISEFQRMPASCRQPGFDIQETTTFFAVLQPHRKRISNRTRLYHITDISNDV